MARPKKLPEQKSIRQNISIPPELLEQVVVLCQEQDRSISRIVRQALIQYMSVAVCNNTQQN